MSFFCIGNEPKSGLARDLGDCLQSRNVPFGTSDDLCNKPIGEMTLIARRAGVSLLDQCGESMNEENDMRLDKFLKVSRLIKRRTVANEACDAGRVLVNGAVAKASAKVKAGDIIEIQFGTKSVKAEVLDIRDTTKKEEAKDLFRYL